MLSEAAGPYSAEGFYAKYVRLNPAPVELEKEGSFGRPYLDPGLKSRRRYAELLCRLAAAGMLSFARKSGKAVDS